MLPPLPAAERSAETAEKQLADDERERGFIREALEEEDVTDKKMRQLAKQLAALDNSVAESTRAAGMARGTLEEVLASLSEEERAARDERLRQKKVAAASSASAPPPPRAAPTSRHPQQQQQQQQQEPVACGEGEIEYLQASELRKGNLVLLGGRVCKVTDLSTSKTGKHGHAKVQITAKVANTGKNVTDSITSQNKAEIPSKAWSAAHKAGLKF
ncbi:hypothetical protein TeGR_g14842 [Tetraparma gracilis]|uniref:Translation initiation factor 5A-like N-terminal domain-containing protein n=1 Tax=Tetraparma gracilis TaxID=2962635 RepID=A0ABQ6MJS3_9STRA|nr:hypothetical protein TeGR_g14842 [Tetraparma gracilis]